MKILKNENGVALLWALVTVSVLLIIAASMSNLIIKESQMARGIDGSVHAYSLAESGVEKGAYLVRSSQTFTCTSVDKDNPGAIVPDPSDTFNLGTEETFEVVITGANISENPSGRCDYFRVESEGKSGALARKVEKVVDYTKNPSFKNYETNPSLVAGSANVRKFHSLNYIASDLAIDTSSESFIQQYKIKFTNNWGGSGDQERVDVGISDTNIEQEVAGNIHYIDVIYWKNATYSSTSCEGLTGITNFTGITVYISNLSAPVCKKIPISLNANTEYTVKLQIQKGSVAKVIIWEGANVDPQNCKGVLSVSLPENFNYTLNYLNFLGQTNVGGTGGGMGTWNQQYVNYDVTKKAVILGDDNAGATYTDSPEAEISYMGIQKF